MANRLGKHKYRATGFFGFSVCNLLHITLLAPIILKWLLDFWKICRPHGIRYVLIILHLWRMSRKMEEITE